jgi:hypothetical protein
LKAPHSAMIGGHIRKLSGFVVLDVMPQDLPG